MSARFIRYTLDGIKLTHDIGFGVTDGDGFDVYVNRTKLDKGIGYKVVGTDKQLRDGDGTITLTIPHAASDVLLILSDTLARRVTNFAKAARFEEAEIDNEFDNLLRLLEDAALNLQSTPYFDPADIGLVDGKLPPIIAEGILRVNANGNGFELIKLDEIDELQDLIKLASDEANRSKDEADRSKSEADKSRDEAGNSKLSADRAQVIAESIEAGAGDYKGLWPDLGGSAKRGDTWQTQINGSPTGRYFVALKDTMASPVNDDANWRRVVSGQSVGDFASYDANSVSDALRGSSVNGSVKLELNQRWVVSDYYGGVSPSNSGVLFFKVVVAGTGTNDGGKYIDVPGGEFQLEQNMKLPVSVKAYGAKLGINSTTNFENAINLYKSVFAPAGVYKVNLRLPCSRLNIKGESKHVTSLEAFDKTKPTITALQGNVWTGATIEQVSIYGGGEDIEGTSCFRFGDLPYVSGQEFSGGMRFVDVNFYEAYACIWKPYGNIGNYLEKCSFYAAKYHYLNHKESATSEYMQQGNDTFKKCHFSYADVCSIYIDSYDGSTGFSTIHFEDCIQEANKGVDFYCRTTKGEYETQQTNLVFSNHHLEYSTKNSQVIVRGDARRITEWVDDDGISDGRGVPAYHLDGVTAMSMSSSNLVRAKLLNSIIQTSNGSSQTKINIADDLSYIDINDPSQKGYTADNYVDSIYAITRATSDPATLATKPRSEKSSDQRGLRGGETFDIDPVQFGSISSSKVRDGVIFGSCQEVEFTAGTHQFTGFASANTDVSAYHIVTLDIKKISDNDADSISISGDNFFLARDLQDITKDRKGVWRSCAGMVRSTGDYQQQPLKVSVVASSNCTYRFSALQVLSFTKISEAYEFLSKGVYALPKGQGLYPIITYGTTPPTTGYWERGDTVIDATPSSGSPIGWKCTAAGEPGVWVPMANL
ncbi:hypothetical protein VP417E501_P0013 [Vibrio phage 417E50-1]|nr:hypothetical protein VP417E501_P0013 [Vibrio phage 417E50-1]